MIDFIKELANHCYRLNLLNNCTKLHAQELYEIAERHHKTVELIYLMQFNYESCETLVDYSLMMINNLM